MEDILSRITRVLLERQTADPESSYVAKLCAGGLNGILQKVGEEATETILAAKDAARSPDQVIRETADLWFHLLVMLVYLQHDPGEVLAELERRLGRSGLEEKASRVDTRALDRFDRQ